MKPLGHGLLRGRIILVTGGARGIGADICRVLVREGATVALNYSTSLAAATEIAEEMEGQGGSVALYRADVRDPEQVSSMVTQIIGAYGRLDGVVNNAIAGAQYVGFSEATPADYQRAFDFGCTAVVNTIRAALPCFEAAGGGRVVNIVTEVWDQAPGQWSVYLAGKGAMVGISRSLAAELGPKNVTVNMVAPGWMITEKVDPSEEGPQGYAASVPLGHQGSAEEIGKACVFFMSDLASFVTGAYLPVTGGRVTQLG